MDEATRGYFTMKGWKPPLLNTYYCDHCHKLEGPESQLRLFLEMFPLHRVVHKPKGETDNTSQWGHGVPCTIRVCTRCGRWDGPWVSSDLVGGFWGN